MIWTKKCPPGVSLSEGQDGSGTPLVNADGSRAELDGSDKDHVEALDARVQPKLQAQTTPRSQLRKSDLQNKRQRWSEDSDNDSIASLHPDDVLEVARPIGDDAHPADVSLPSSALRVAEHFSPGLQTHLTSSTSVELPGEYSEELQTHLANLADKIDGEEDLLPHLERVP